VRDRVLEASEQIPVEQLGTTDDCGCAAFSDDASTNRETAFARVGAQVMGTETCREAYRSSRVMTADNEDSLLRSVAQQNPERIRAGRLRAEQHAEATLREQANLLNLSARHGETDPRDGG
jgi:IS5 family transposase